MKRVCLKIEGLVQGVGFRPFVYSHATKFHLFGFISNTPKGVHIELEGAENSIEEFIKSLHQKLPPLARIDSIEKSQIECKNDKEFIIKKSEFSETKTSAVLPDMAICDDCLKEMKDPKNRRFNYPFINCTNCGPRYSIIQDIPYDRPFTSMAKFTMCDECKKEYENPLNRRYHAQPISCKNCGPKLFLDGKVCENAEAIQKIAELINDGKIVAIKGIGGFHLVCDALNEKPIKALREFKARPTKPFAIMCKDLQQAFSHVKINSDEENALLSIEKPIVLLDKKDNSHVNKLVAPHTSRLGIFLPNTPLHVMLFDYLKNPIIATSANIKSEPIITKKEDLDEKFGDLLSGILDYDRDILHPCDDSLMQMIGDKKLYLRVSRGIAPLTISHKSSVKKNILAVGVEQKNAIAFYINGRIILSAYLGGMGTLKTYELFEKTIESWKRFYDIEFDEIIHDNHPQYTTTKYATTQNIKTTSVNHYHAHILATMIDRKIPLNTKVLGVAWDGTGYGDDGTIWGGEFLVVKGKSYKRVAHFKPFKLLGGDKSVKNIDRIAYSMMLDIGEDLSELESLKFLSQMHKKNINAPLCSSVGRLFDAVCYFTTGLKEVSYDGESGLLLESLYDEEIFDAYTLEIKNGVITYDKMLKQIIKDRKNLSGGGTSVPLEDQNIMQTQVGLKSHPRSLIATKFINALADIIVKIATAHNLPVVLSGGVFQNKTLLTKLQKKLPNAHFPQTLTPNDGSICVGQIAYGLI